MVTLIPTSITNKDMATPSPAMATTPCTATQPPTTALATLVSFLAVTWPMLELLIMELVIMEWLTMGLLIIYQQDMGQATELLSHLWVVDLDMATDMGTDTATSATTRERK